MSTEKFENGDATVISTTEEQKQQQSKEQEKKKTMELLGDMRTRFQQEKASELERQKEILIRNFEAELQRLLHQKEEELKKAKAETRKVKEDLTLQVRDAERRAAIQSPPIVKEGLNRKLVCEVAELRGIKRRLEEALGDVMNSDKKNTNEIRKLHEEHVAELNSMKKEAESEIRKLLSELKAKDRTIKQLKGELCILNERKGIWCKHQWKHQDKTQTELQNDSKGSNTNSPSNITEQASNSICVLSKQNPYKRKYVSNSTQNSDIEESQGSQSDVKRKERKILKTSQVPEIMYKRLYKEHLELQRSFALLRQLVTETKGQQGNNKNVVMLTEENHKLGHIALQLKNKIQKLRRELKETHDQNELLEFCVLEMENQGKSNVIVKSVECGVNTEAPCDPSSVVPNILEFEKLVSSHKCHPINEEQVRELQKELKHVYQKQGITADHRHTLVKIASHIQDTYLTICNLQNSIACITKKLEEAKKEKESHICPVSDIMQNYEECKKHLDETKQQLLDVSEQLATVQKREATFHHLEQINNKFKEHLQMILQDFHVLLSSHNVQESNVQTLKEKINHLYKIEKEVILQAEKAGTLQASPNPLLSEIGEGIICKFTQQTEKYNIIGVSDNVVQTQSQLSDNKYRIHELQTKLKQQELIIEEFTNRQKELLKTHNELTSKLTEHESTKYDLTQKINTLEKSEQDLVEKNLKLYIDYVSAKEEVQKLFIELEERQEISSTSSAHEVKNSCTKVERTLSEESDLLATMTSEDEGLGEESRRGDSTGPSSLADLQESEEDLLNRTSDFELENVDDHKSDLEISQNCLADVEINKQEYGIECYKMKSKWKKEIEELKTREKELLEKLQYSQNLISELRENIKVKEEQVRKLLVENCTDSCKCHEQELQVTIAKMQKDLTDLQERLALSEHSKNSLKEQILELEEAENDARLAGQKLQEKLISSVEKEDNLQKELEKYKNYINESIDQIQHQNTTETELRSQMKYMEFLVHKYEDHIRELEASKSELQQKVNYLDLMGSFNDQSYNTENFKKSLILHNNNNNNKTGIMHTTSISSSIEEIKNNMSAIHFKTVSTQTDNKLLQCHSSVIQDNCVQATSPCEVSNFAQQELLQRLNVLEKEDQTLCEQLHQMDGMNLALWKKLHSLETDVGKCMKDYITHISFNQIDIPNRCNTLSSELENNTSLNSSCSEVNDKQLHQDHDQQIVQRILFLETNEQKLKDRLHHLEHINHEFEKELEIREKLYKEKETQHKKWLEVEKTLQEIIRNLENEKSCLLNKVFALEEDKQQLHRNIENLQLELETLKNNHDSALKELELNHEKTLEQLKTRQQNFDTLEAKQIQRIAELEQEQSVFVAPKVLEINVEKYDLITCKLELLKKDHASLKENAKRNKAEIEKIVKDFEQQFNMLTKIQKCEEEKLKSDVDNLVAKEKEYNSQIIDMLQKQTILENELISKESELEQTKKIFQKQMKFLEEEHHVIESELKWKMREMEENAAVAVKELKEERTRLETNLQADLEDLHKKESAYKLRIMELESCVDSLRDEVDKIANTNDSKCDDEKLGINSDNSTVLKKIEEMAKNEKQMKERLNEMEKKEEAYKETLEHAEKIISTLEQSYNEKIEELESSERSLKLRVSQLEEVENRLRCTLHNEKRTSELRKSSDLIEELMESEIREATLREHIKELETHQRTLLQKLQEMDENRKCLQEELGDHDEMVRTIEKLQHQEEILKKKLLSVQHSENALQETLEQADEILIQREDELRQNMIRVEEEKKGLEETISQLRKQVRELESKIEKSQYEKLSLIGEQLYETVDNSDSDDEYQQQEEPTKNFRSENTISLTQKIKDLERIGNELREEVTHLKQSLSAANAHLIDLDSLNRKQCSTIFHLEEEKVILQKQSENFEKLKIKYNELEVKFNEQEKEKSLLDQHIKKLQEEQKLWEGLGDANSQLQKQVTLLQEQLACLQFKQLDTDSIKGAVSEDENMNTGINTNKFNVDCITAEDNENTIKDNSEDICVISQIEAEEFGENFQVQSLAKMCQTVLNFPKTVRSKTFVITDESVSDCASEIMETDQIKDESQNPCCQLEIERYSPVSWSTMPGTVSLEDLTTGLEAKLQLEQCVLRAVAAMEREMQLKEASKVDPIIIDSGDSNLISVVESQTKNILTADTSQDNSVKGIPNFRVVSTEVIKSEQQSNTSSVNPLPPNNFRILRQIGDHSLLVGWTIPKEGAAIGGYQIYVEGQLQQKVRSPDRTKALLPKLNVVQPLNISIYSISTSGHTSEPASIFHPGISQKESSITAKELPFVCITECSCVLRISTLENEGHEVSVQKGSHVLVCSAPDSEGFCTVKVNGLEGKLPFNVLREIGKLPY